MRFKDKMLLVYGVLLPVVFVTGWLNVHLLRFYWVVAFVFAVFLAFKKIN